MSLKPLLPLPSAEFLRNYLSYDPETGILTWKVRVENYRMAKPFNKKCAGREALASISKCGYKYGSIVSRRKLTAHRVIWKMHYGEEPGEIDHINGIRTDNRLCNLRVVTRSENQRNKALEPKNKTGCYGVTYYKPSKSYRVRILGRHIGMFSDLQEAVAVRKLAEKQEGFNQGHGKVLHGARE